LNEKHNCITHILLLNKQQDQHTALRTTDVKNNDLRGNFFAKTAAVAIAAAMLS